MRIESDRLGCRLRRFQRSRRNVRLDADLGTDEVGGVPVSRRAKVSRLPGRASRPKRTATALRSSRLNVQNGPAVLAATA